MSDPKITLQKRIIVRDGMSLQTIQQKGSDGQKIAAPLFDYNDNGKLEGEEVTNFNNYRFKTESDKKSGTNTLTLSRWVNDPFCSDKKKLDRTTVIKYNSLEQLYNTKGRTDYPGVHAGNYIEPYEFNAADFKSFGNGSGVSIQSPYKRAEINMTENKVLIDEMTQKEYGITNIDAINIDLTVKNSDIGNLLMYNGKLKLENTKSLGFYDKPVDVATNGVDKVKVQKDSKSKANVFTWGEIAH